MPELLDGTNHVAWFEAGATIFSKQGIQYLGIPGLVNARSIIATLLVQVRSLGCEVKQRHAPLPATSMMMLPTAALRVRDTTT